MPLPVTVILPFGTTVVLLLVAVTVVLAIGVSLSAMAKFKPRVLAGSVASLVPTAPVTLKGEVTLATPPSMKLLVCMVLRLTVGVAPTSLSVMVMFWLVEPKVMPELGLLMAKVAISVPSTKGSSTTVNVTEPLVWPLGIVI